MSPNRKWFRNLTYCRVPVKLASKQIVYAVGRGSILFMPTINGKCGESIYFQNCLYVPALQNNLFSILTVVRQSKVRVVIEGETLEFFKNGETLVTATIQDNVGMLDGYTHNANESAYLARIPKELLHK